MKHEEATENMAAERYVLGELHDTELEQFEEHFFDCRQCAQDVRDLSALAAGTRQLLGQPQAKEAPVQRATATGFWPWQWRWSMPAFALAGALALETLFCGYQAVTLRLLMRPQVLPSVVLKPETRGAAISVANTRPFLPPLEVYLDGSDGKVQWDLRPAGSDKVIFQRTDDSPKRGDAVDVLLPSSELAPGEYTLAFHSVAPTGKSWFFKFNLISGKR